MKIKKMQLKKMKRKKMEIKMLIAVKMEFAGFKIKIR